MFFNFLVLEQEPFYRSGVKNLENVTSLSFTITGKQSLVTTLLYFKLNLHSIFAKPTFVTGCSQTQKTTVF